MLFKDGRGQVLEDVDHYDALCRIMNNMKTKQNLADRAVTHKEGRIETDISHGAEYMKGKTVIHELHSGVLGASQDFLIPVSAMTTVAGYAFQLELWLNDVANERVGSTDATKPTCKISEVCYDLELIEVTPEIMSDINNELNQGSQIPVPYN
jgi:hypothetical protein